MCSFGKKNWITIRRANKVTCKKKLWIEYFLKETWTLKNKSKFNSNFTAKIGVKKWWNNHLAYYHVTLFAANREGWIPENPFSDLVHCRPYTCNAQYTSGKNDIWNVFDPAGWHYRNRNDIILLRCRNIATTVWTDRNNNADDRTAMRIVHPFKLITPDENKSIQPTCRNITQHRCYYSAVFR